MGNKQTTFTDEQLDAYQDCTFFTRKEILRVFKRYRELNPEIVPRVMHSNISNTVKVPSRDVQDMPEFKLPLKLFLKMQELQENPFKRRICEVFSVDGSGNMSFDDFIDMFSVFSEAAPRDLKAIYAFRIYDFDGDGFLGKEDLQRTVNCLTRHELSFTEVDFICDKVLEETDGRLSYSEFEHVISRAPDFLSTFHIRI